MAAAIAIARLVKRLLAFCISTPPIWWITDHPPHEPVTTTGTRYLQEPPRDLCRAAIGAGMCDAGRADRLHCRAIHGSQSTQPPDDHRQDDRDRKDQADDQRLDRPVDVGEAHGVLDRTEEQDRPKQPSY